MCGAASASEKVKVRCKRSESEEEARERGVACAAVTVYPDVLLVLLCLISLQRKETPLRSKECWVALTTETREGSAPRPRPSSRGTPPHPHPAQDVAPGCCRGLDTISDTSAAALNLTMFVSSKAFPSAGLSPQM